MVCILLRRRETKPTLAFTQRVLIFVQWFARRKDARSNAFNFLPLTPNLQLSFLLEHEHFPLTNQTGMSSDVEVTGLLHLCNLMKDSLTLSEMMQRVQKSRYCQVAGE